MIFEELQTEMHSAAGVSVLRLSGLKHYTSPQLREHGRFERMTLQTSGTGNSQTGDDGTSG